MNNILDLSSSLDFNNSNVIKGEIEIDDVFELENNIEILVQDKIIEPTREIQTVTADEDYDQLGTVTVNPIPDEYIIPDGTLDVDANGDVDVTMFRMARVGVYTPPTLQDKSIEIVENGTINITADEGYDGLNSVTVNTNAIEDLSEELIDYNAKLTIQKTSIQDIIVALEGKAAGSGSGDKGELSLQDKTVEITENGTYTIKADEGYAALGNVIINTNVNSGEDIYITNCSNLCSSLPQNNLSHVLKACKPVTGKNMFYGNNNITSVDLSTVDLSNLQSADYMFYGCTAITEINLGNFYAPKCTTMERMFYNNASLKRIDFSKATVPTSCTFTRLLYGCSTLEYADLSGINFTNGTASENFLRYVPTTCTFIVKRSSQKDWLLRCNSALTNILIKDDQ